MDPEQLYRLPPEEFTVSRDEAAKAARAGGDADTAKELKTLRKPTVSAWLVNLLAAQQPDLVEQLLALGPALATAQAAGQGDELRALGAQRRELVDAVTQQAVALADRSVTAAVRDEVAATLEAALADPGAAEAVRSGRLVRALSYAGFGGVDLEGAVAGGSAAAAGKRPPRKAPADKPPAKTADLQRAERIAAAEAAALAAAGRLDDVVRECEQAERDREAAETAAAAARDEVERLRQAMQLAESSAREADHRRISAERSSEKAVQAVRRAQAAEEQARAELDRLRRA